MWTFTLYKLCTPVDTKKIEGVKMWVWGGQKFKYHRKSKDVCTVSCELELRDPTHFFGLCEGHPHPCTYIDRQHNSWGGHLPGWVSATLTTPLYQPLLQLRRPMVLACAQDPLFSSDGPNFTDLANIFAFLHSIYTILIKFELSVCQLWWIWERI